MRYDAQLYRGVLERNVQRTSSIFIPSVLDAIVDNAFWLSRFQERHLVSCHLEIDVTYISKHYQANNFFVLPHNSKYLPFRC